MFTKLRKVLVGLLTFSLSLTGIVATEAPSYALNASTFDPGWIISDSVFFDWGTMDAADIQKFLNARVATCTDDDGGPKCIKNYREDVVGSYAIRGSLHNYSDRICADVPASTNQTAAQIIAKVAVACKINPRVLIVTLQKEQGLISAADPTTYMYKAAMGYGCPDSAPEICGQDSNSKSRLFWQLYRAAWQLRWYGDPRGSFTYLKPGKYISMGYNPNSSCGKKSFKLKSQATANLYYYTPYVPNKAALDNLWGSGDSCSAYGNRNFWRQFWTWFGSPVAGGYLLKSSTSQTYLVNQTTSKRFLITNESMVKDFEPLGPLGTVSEDYIASFTDGGELKPLVSDAAGKRYLVASGLKYEIATSAQATALGLDWVTAPQLTDVQISNFGDLTFGKSATTDETFLLNGSTRALINNAELLKTLSKLGSTAVIQDTVLNGFTLANPVTNLVQDSSGNRFDIEDGLKIPIGSQSIASALGHNWNTATVVDTEKLSRIATAAFMKTSGSSTTYYLGPATKHNVISSAMLNSMSKFGSTATVTADYLAKFPSGNTIGALLKSDIKTYYVNAGHKFVVTPSQASAMGYDATKAVLVATTQLATLPSPLLIKASNGGSTYLVDDYLAKHPVTDADLSSYTTLSAVGVVPAAYLSAIPTKTDPARMVNSTDGLHYFLLGAKKYRILNVATAKSISPSTFGAGTDYASLPTLTTSQLSKYPLGSSTAYVTTYVKTTGLSYIIENGTRREILDSASLTAHSPTPPALSALSALHFKALPLGAPIIADNNIFKTTESSNYGLYISGVYYPMSSDLYNDVKAAATWRFTKSTGTLTSASVAKLSAGVKLSNFAKNASSGFLLTAAGKQAVTDIQNVVASPATLPNVILDKIDPATNLVLTTPLVVRESNSATTSFLIGDQKARTILDADEANKLLPLTTGGIAQIWPKYVIAQLTAGNKVLSPASVVKVKESGNIYLIDGLSRGLRVSAATAAAFTKAKLKVVTRADLTGYNTTGTLDWQKITCGADSYLVDGGVPLLLDQATASQWPKTAKALDAKTCQKLRPTTTRVGVFVANGSAKYKVIGGKLKAIRTPAEYTAMLGNQTPAALVSSELIASMPKLNPTSYVVVANDTLYKVAVKFKTTRAILRTLNNLATDVLQRGQVLILP
ncbi:MAG: hypothetical protein RLZZ380_476 [Actinomycetota bacterium]